MTRQQLMSQNFLTLSPLVGIVGGFCRIYHSKVMGLMGSFREISPGSHLCVGRVPQAVYLSMADSLPASDLQGNLGQGTEKGGLGTTGRHLTWGRIANGKR